MKVCQYPDCPGKHYSAGWCRSHYDQVRRYGKPTKPLKAVRQQGVEDRVLDRLQADGGWLTIAGIQLELGDYNKESVRRVLSRLVKRGDLERREVPLASGAWGHRRREGVEVRHEWRAL